jgi:hypothetical protein
LVVAIQSLEAAHSHFLTQLSQTAQARERALDRLTEVLANASHVHVSGPSEAAAAALSASPQQKHANNPNNKNKEEKAGSGGTKTESAAASASTAASPTSPSAPSAAPASAANTAGTNVGVDWSVLLAHLRDPKHGVSVTDRWWRLRKYPACVVASEVVDWCVWRCAVPPVPSFS